MIKKSLLSIASIVLLLTIIVVSGYFYLQHFAEQKISLSTDNQLFTLQKGTSFGRLAQQMEEEKLLENSKPLLLLMRIEPSLQRVKAGTYRLLPNMTVRDFLQLLSSGKEAQFTIQFIEGTKAKDWLTTLESAPYITHQLSEKSLSEIAERLGIENHIEGWFYPDTYHYTYNTSDIAILSRAYQKTRQHLQVVWDNRDEGLPYKTPYELLIMASIIEKETGVESERSLVASVFVNRLRKGMRLQTDPTVIYGMGDRYDGNIRRRDLAEATPYNTYVINGLPPTPIAMPGIASLEAAAHPAKSNFLYFVADGYGGHTFTTNLKSHNLAVQEYLKIMRSRN